MEDNSQNEAFMGFDNNIKIEFAEDHIESALNYINDDTKKIDNFCS